MPGSHEIFGTTLFDGAMAQRGYALNKMCFSFNSADNRDDVSAATRTPICARYGLNDRQAEAIRKRDVLGLLAAGGNVYYLAKFAGILGLDVQDLGAAQTGMTKEEFKARLVAAERTTRNALKRRTQQWPQSSADSPPRIFPPIGGAIAKGLQQEPYWKPFFDGFEPARAWLARQKPDVVVVFYNDHGLNFFLDKMPTFAVGAAAEYRNDDEGWGIPTLPPFRGIPTCLGRSSTRLIASDFDIVTCQEMLVDHAFTVHP